MFLVAGINALRAVADEKIRVHFKSRALLEQRHTKLLGCTRVYRGLVDDDIALTQDLADGFACGPQGRQ